MRHAKAHFALNRFTSWRKATTLSLVRALLIHQRIKTTKVKAKAARLLAERIVSFARKNSLFSRRQAYRLLGDHRLVRLLFNDIGPRFQNRNSGFTRIISLGCRRGDNAELAILELTEIKKEAKKKLKKAKAQKLEEDKKTETSILPAAEEKKTVTEGIAKEEYPKIVRKPAKRFWGGLRKIFKKERDSL